MSTDVQETGHVEQSTPDEVNERIQILTRARVRDFSDRLDAIEARLKVIDGEWDIERTLEANAAAVSLLGIVLARRWKRFSLLPLTVSAFLLQHAIQGWCPPVSLFRRLGVRTRREIDRERYALKAMRGDFEGIGSDPDGQSKAWRAYQAT